MTRKIKAQDVKPGMDIGWDERGYRYAIGVARVDVALHGNGMCPSPMVEIYNEYDYSTVFHPEFEVEVTVDLPPQPEEPTTFGARVVVDGVQFIRRGGGSTYAWEASFGTCFTWDDLLRLGHVTVVPDQGWTVPAGTPEVPDATERRTWDRWGDVPDMVAVRSITGNLYRKAPDGTERQTLDGEWCPSILATSKICSLAPFTEVPISRSN